MAKKKRNGKKHFQKHNNKLTYNTANPNRQARRSGIVAVEKQDEEPKKVSKAAVLTERANEAKAIQKKIVPPGMTYGEYMQYLKEKRQQLKEKTSNIISQP